MGSHLPSSIHHLCIIHPSSIHHPYIIHPSSIHHPSIIRPSSIHPSSLVHSSSVHHSSIIHPSSNHHPSIIRPSSFHRQFISKRKGVRTLGVLLCLGLHAFGCYPFGAQNGPKGRSRLVQRPAKTLQGYPRDPQRLPQDMLSTFKNELPIVEMVVVPSGHPSSGKQAFKQGKSR